jgi:hypothetical protein
MDELDRLFRRLVQNARAASPEYLARPFELAEIYHTLLPYRLNRRELGMESVQQYDGALMRLLAGERGYLTGDADMQRAMQEELRQPNPDISAFRAHATAPVAFAPDAVRQLERDTLSPARSEAVAARGAASSDGGPRAAAPTMPPAPAVAPPATSASPPPPPSAPVIVPMNEGVQLAATGEAARGTAGAPGVGGVAGSGRCQHCGSPLPAGREIAFCPHCGQNLTVRHCPACSTELEVGWRFCITCGRNVEESSPPRS